eukprot:3890512-Prymnesium_polylepis.1
MAAFAVLYVHAVVCVAGLVFHRLVSFLCRSFGMRFVVTEPRIIMLVLFGPGALIACLNKVFGERCAKSGERLNYECELYCAPPAKNDMPCS